MTFEEWKQAQIENGNIIFAKINKGRLYPYSSTSGFGYKYQRLAGGKTENVHLTFDEYLFKVFEAGITIEQIGKGIDDYQLARYTDSGPYTVDSCRYVTHRVNREEWISNGGQLSSSNNNSDENNYKFSGYYVTPKGKFACSNKAGEINNCTGATVIRRCKNCDVTIKPNSTCRGDISPDDVGKTYRDIGWHFEEKNNAN